MRVYYERTLQIAPNKNNCLLQFIITLVYFPCSTYFAYNMSSFVSLSTISFS
jgi:hypothetical protein